MDLPGFSKLVRLHEGGQAVVFRGHRLLDGLPVVLKILQGPYPTPAQQAAFEEEHRLTVHVAGPGVVEVEDSLTAGSLSVLVLRDAGCESLERTYREPPDQETTLWIARELVTVLDRIHQAGVLHLDVNPANVVVDPGRRLLQVIDFGVSTDRGRLNAELAAARTARGTVAFAAPEQSGPMNRSVDHRADYYALGATLYWLLTGRPPFEAADPLELIHAHIARRPRSPEEIAGVDPGLSGLVLKLLEKNPEDRYQSAAGMLADLDRVARGERFTPGADDRPSRFVIPERLYGREAAHAALVAAFERVRLGGREVVFVEGSSGMGKTSLVREACRAMPQAGLVTGKFDPFEQNRPFASLSRALGQFVRRLLSGRPSEVEAWRERIRVAVGPNGSLLTDLMPELELLMGEQPTVPELPALEAEARLHRTLRRFVRALGSVGRPLVLFLDDLQWADAPSLAVLEVLATDAAGSMLLIGAYRQDEIGPRLRGVLHDLTQSGVKRSTVAVGPLTTKDITHLLGETLGRTDVEPLARTCLEKTRGNPFFLHRFLGTVAERGLVSLQGDRWSWDGEAIAGLDVTDNVVGFLAARVAELPSTTQRSLQAAAVLGGSFSEDRVADLVTVLELEDALGPGLIEEVPREGDGRRFRFAHDRVREAVYAGIDAQRLQRLHGAVGRQLLASGDGRLYEVVEHLNASGPPEDPVELARLNLAAGRRALAASAYAPARAWLTVARTHFSWSEHGTAMREATEGAARAAYLTGDHEGMSELVDEALAHAGDDVDRIRALRVRIDALISQNRNADALDVGLEALQLLGRVVPSVPEDAQIQEALLAVGAQLEGVDLTQLPARPSPDDPRVRAAMELTCALAPPAYFVNQKLLPLLGAELVRTTVEHGPMAESSYGFALLGLVLCTVGELDKGYAFGQLAQGLAMAFDDRRARVRARHVTYGFVRHWKEPVAQILPDYRALFDVAVDIGDFEYAGYAGMMYSIFGFYQGGDVLTTLRAARHFTDVMAETRQEPSLAVHSIQHQALLNLRGESSEPTELTGEVFDEPRMLALFEELQDPTSLFVLHCVKGVLAGLYGAWDVAGEALDVAVQYPNGAGSTVHLVMLDQYRALTALRRVRAGQDAMDVARFCLGRLKTWAEHNPVAHGHRPRLVEAELARTEGRVHEALQGFEAAAKQAAAAGLVMDEAVALRLAGETCLEDGLSTAARAYLLEARYAFERWGALGIAEAMEQQYPTRLGNLSRSSDGTPNTLLTSSSSATDLDVTAVVRVSQAVAKENELDRLIETIVRISMEATGAQRCVVVSPDQDGLILAATGTAEPELAVVQSRRPLDGTEVSEAIVRYVSRTRETVVLASASRSDLFGDDAYVRTHRPVSVLCVPIEQQGRLLAVIYLEHRSIEDLFTEQRLALLGVVFGQAAIAVDNARLIDTLEEKVRARTRELAAATDRALSANQAKTVFLRSMSHELRTPLNAILGFTQLLEQRRADPDAHEDAVRTIANSGRHLLSLVDDLLDMGRIEAGKLELDLEDVRLQGFTEAVTGLFGPAVREKRLGFRVSCEGLPETLRTDPRRLRQILINLVGNAVKFTDHGSIAVTVRQVGGWLRFVVEDTGPGIRPDRLERIFDPFEQVGAASQRAMGTGLGLAIARQIARQMGGELTVESTVGRGSAFTLELPLDGEAPALDASSKLAIPPPAAEDIARPPEPVLAELRQLAEEGAMSALASRADALAEEAELRTFGERLARVARDFDDEGVDSLLR